MSQFDFLPSETIIEIALRLPVSDISLYCQTSKRFNDMICNNNYFWREKFLYDYGPPEDDVNITSWKYAYENYGKVVNINFR